MPSVTKEKVVPPRISTGSRAWWVRTKTGAWKGGSSPHQPVPWGVVAPRTGAAAEHVAAHDHGPHVRLHLLDDRGARVDHAALHAMLPTPGLELEDPLVQLHPAHAERVLLALIGPRDVTVERDRQLELTIPIADLLA